MNWRINIDYYSKYAPLLSSNSRPLVFLKPQKSLYLFSLLTILFLSACTNDLTTKTDTSKETYLIEEDELKTIL